MLSSAIIVGLGAVVNVALAQYVNTVVESSTVTVVSCGPEVSTCAGHTTSTPVLETTICSTSIETVEITEYSTYLPHTSIPTTPGYITSTQASPVVPTTPVSAPTTSEVHPHASVGITTEVPPTTEVHTYGGSISKAPNSTAVPSESAIPSYISPSTLTNVHVAPSKTSATSSPSIRPTSGAADSVAAPGLMTGLLALGSYLFV